MVTLDWFLTIPFSTLVAAAVLYPKLRTNWLYWTVMTGICAGYVVARGLASENVFFLFVYISLAVLIALFSDNPYLSFRRNARLIIGIVFLFASLWKLMSPDFLSGSFFTFMLIADDRLGPFGAVATAISLEDIATNRSIFPVMPDMSHQLMTAPGIPLLAQMLTWMTFAIEFLVAIVFLVPLKPLYKIRDYALLLFLLTAYVFVPVPAFAMSFATLGYAQTDSARFQSIYKVVFVVMPLTAARYYLVSWG
ncbi:MAG: hypothetical protein ACRCYY_21440 [Trueperaceae bacterium]